MLLNRTVMKLKKRYVLRFLNIIAVLCAVAVLFSGCALQSSEDWVREKIKQNYYRFDGDYSSLSDLDGLSIEEMVKKLDDYSAYYTGPEYAAVLSDAAGNKSGIGVSYKFLNGVGVVLQSVVGNSPAKRNGLKAGDVIVSASVNGSAVQFNVSEDFSSFIKARATNEQFTLYLDDGTSISIAKEEYTASYVSMYTHNCNYEIEYDGAERLVTENSEGGIPQLPEGTAYMYLSQFFGNAVDEMAELFSIFNSQNCTSLILDLRDDGGGYVDVMAQIGGLFTTEVTDSAAVAMVAKYKDGYTTTDYCTYYKDRADYYRYYRQYMLPKGTAVYVIANNNTASASEALIGVLVSNDILEYENIFLSQYGEAEAKSYGKGIMQSTFRKKFTGEALKLTVAGIYWENGKTIHGKGLTVEDGCSVAPASDSIVNVGYDDELEPVIAKIIADNSAKN